MKRLLTTAILVILALAIIMPGAYAASSGTFNITITCEYYALVLRNFDDSAPYGTWAAGTLAQGESTSMTQNQGVLCSFSANNSYRLQGYASDNNGWECSGVAALDAYILEVTAKPTAAAANMTGALKLSNSGAYKAIITDVANDTSKTLYFRITAPTDSSTSSQHTIVVTLQISKSQ